MPKDIHMDLNKTFISVVIALFTILGGSNVTLVYLYGGVSKDIEYIKGQSEDRYTAKDAAQDWRHQELIDEQQKAKFELLKEKVDSIHQIQQSRTMIIQQFKEDHKND